MAAKRYKGTKQELRDDLERSRRYADTIKKVAIANGVDSYALESGIARELGITCMPRPSITTPTDLHWIL